MLLVLNGTRCQLGSSLQKLIKHSSLSNPRKTIQNHGFGLLQRSGYSQPFSPLSFGFLGLILTIFLWGTAYRLSLYHPHPTPSARTRVAKLWSETRSSELVSHRTIKDKTNAGMDVHALVTRNQPFVRSAGTLASLADLSRRQAVAPALQIPARSPPSCRFYVV